MEDKQVIVGGILVVAAVALLAVWLYPSPATATWRPGDIPVELGDDFIDQLQRDKEIERYPVLLPGALAI